MIPLLSPHFFAVWLCIALVLLFATAIIYSAVEAVRAQRRQHEPDWQAEIRKQNVLDEYLRAERRKRDREIAARAAEGASEIGGSP